MYGLYFSFYDEKLFEKMNPNIDHVLLDGLRNIVENTYVSVNIKVPI